MPSTSVFYEAHSPSTQKGQLLRELNAENRDIQVALNQIQSSLTHVMRLQEQMYQRKRAQIINNHGDELLT